MTQRISIRDLKKGMKARIASLEEGGELTDRLQELGLVPGTEILVTRVAPLGDPVEIEVRGYHLCIRRQECGCLALEKID